MPARRFGQYEVLARLATGGAANIFLARQPGAGGFKTLVCLKTLLPERASDHEFVEMFLDEARLAARLSHPNCVEIYDLGKEAGTYYISMEYILGETLWSLLSTVAEFRAPLPSLVVATILASTCEGLHHAHELVDPQGRPYNLVHRDVSPQNVMISYEGQTKVLDFGIAKAETGREATATGIVKGKFSYMSPEQITGGSIDRRSDIYSLGIVMFECLASRRLYRADTPEEIARMMLERRPPRLRDLVPDVDPVLESIAAKALARHPNNRFNTARDMADALREYLHAQRFPDGTAPVARLIEERFGPRIIERRRIFGQALEGSCDESELLNVLNARPVLEIDLFPNIDLIQSDPLAPDPTEALPPEALERAMRDVPPNEPARRSSPASAVSAAVLPARAGGSLEGGGPMRLEVRTNGRQMERIDLGELPSMRITREEDGATRLEGERTVIEVEGDATDIPPDEEISSTSAATNLQEPARTAEILNPNTSETSSARTDPELEHGMEAIPGPSVPDPRRLRDPALTRPLPKADPIPSARPRHSSQPKNKNAANAPTIAKGARRSDPPVARPRRPLAELGEVPTFDQPLPVPMPMRLDDRSKAETQPEVPRSSGALIAAPPPQMVPQVPEPMALPVTGPPSEIQPAAMPMERAREPVAEPRPQIPVMRAPPGQSYSIGVVIAALAFGVTLGLLLGVLLTLFR